MQFQEERLWAAAAGLMKMERVIAQTIEYTRDRKAFGKSILDNQVVHFRLAELADRDRASARAGLSRGASYISPART